MRGLVVLAAAGAMWITVVGLPPWPHIKVPRIRLRTIVASLGAGVVGSAVALGLLGTVAPALAIGALCAAIPARLDRSREDRLQREQTDRWPDLIAQIRSSVAAGATLPDAFVDSCDRAGGDFRRFGGVVRHEVTFGGGFEPALLTIRHEMDDPIADRVLATLAIAQRTGGRRVGDVLDAIGGSVADEIRLRRAHDAALTEQRWTATVALVAPWMLLALSIGTNPQAASAFDTAEGMVVVMGGLLATSGGWMLARRASRLSAPPRVFE